MTRRLLLTYLTFALLILVSLEVPLGYVYHRSEQEHAFGQLEHDAEVLAAFVDSALSDDQPGRIKLLALESAQRIGGQVEVVNARGELMSSTHPENQTPGPLGVASDIQTVLEGRGHTGTRLAESGGVKIMSVAVPIHPGTAPHGAIRMSVPAETMTTRIERFWMILGGAGIGVLIMVALIAFALARWISKPVRELERATRRLADGTLQPTATTTTGPPELRRLAATFYATATRMQALIESQRSFVGHASHQLKTPLAALRLRLENLEPDIAAEGANNLRAALNETDRLALMVETLLAMARYEQTTLPRQPVAMASVVADRIYQWSALAAEQGVRLTTVAGTSDAEVWAIPGAVDQIIDNLVSNALRVAPRGSAISIGWHRVAGPAAAVPVVELHVIDEGPGLTAEQCKQALEPFWRAPDAAKGGTGLGLSVVRKLAEAGGGEVTLQPASRNGIDAVVTFPAQDCVAV